MEATVPADDGLWQDSGLAWSSDVLVRYTASFAGTGEVVVRGQAEGTLANQCRRCLRAVPTPFEQELTLVFVAEEGEEDADSGDAYPFPVDSAELDVGRALREEMILARDPYVVCDPGCQGLCPHCGAHRGEEVCECKIEETDPRWDALRALQNE